MLRLSRSSPWGSSSCSKTDAHIEAVKELDARVKDLMAFAERYISRAPQVPVISFFWFHLLTQLCHSPMEYSPIHGRLRDQNGARDRWHRTPHPDDALHPLAQERHGTSVEDGLVYYTQTEEVVRVPRVLCA